MCVRNYKQANQWLNQAYVKLFRIVLIYFGGRIPAASMLQNCSPADLSICCPRWTCELGPLPGVSGLAERTQKRRLFGPRGAIWVQGNHLNAFGVALEVQGFEGCNQGEGCQDLIAVKTWLKRQKKKRTVVSND